MTTRIGLLVALLCCASAAHGQGASTPSASSAEPLRGINAGVSFGGIAVAFDDEARVSHFAWRVEGGYRFALWGPLRPVRLTPKLSLLATHVGGMNPSKDSDAYASVDLALRATLAKWRIRPYVEPRKATQTAELLDRRSRILNYKGSGTAWSVGIEIPISPSGRGFELGVTVENGRFTEFEYQKAITPADVSHKAVAFHVGWSGPFTGISLPWR